MGWHRVYCILLPVLFSLVLLLCADTVGFLCLRAFAHGASLVACVVVFCLICCAYIALVLRCTQLGGLLCIPLVRSRSVSGCIALLLCCTQLVGYSLLFISIALCERLYCPDTMLYAASGLFLIPLVRTCTELWI